MKKETVLITSIIDNLVKELQDKRSKYEPYVRLDETTGLHLKPSGF
jgi:hypothetical protein